MVKTIERRMVPPEKLVSSMCAWDGCTATHGGPMPEGWHRMLVWWSPEPTFDLVEIFKRCDRDSVLCPEHAGALKGQLKDLGRWADEPAQGNA